MTETEKLAKAVTILLLRNRNKKDSIFLITQPLTRPKNYPLKSPFDDLKMIRGADVHMSSMFKAED